MTSESDDKEDAFFEESKALRFLAFRLLDKNLISSIEHRIIVGAARNENKKLFLYELLKEKDVETAIEILKIIRNEDLEDDESSDESQVQTDEKDNPLVPRRNPMHIETVIQNVFTFLNIKDIKNCSTVCHKWNSLADTVLRKRAKLRFDNIEDLTTCFESHKLYFSDKPFTAFKFYSLEAEDLWEIQYFSFVFSKWGQYVTQLEFDNVNLVASNGSVSEDFDIGIWLSKFVNLAKLKIACHYGDTKLIVSFDTLTSSIKNISLRECSLNVASGVKISPQKVRLDNVSFLRNDIEITEFRINDAIDFRQASEIILDYSEDIIDIDLNLDVASEIVKAEFVSLNSVIVINWSNSKWIVDNLDLENVPFLEKTGMKIRDLKFTQSSIDLSSLPQSIESLNFDNEVSQELDISGDDNLCLPNLKSVAFGSQSEEWTRIFDLLQLYEGVEGWKNFKDLVFRSYAEMFSIEDDF